MYVTGARSVVDSNRVWRNSSEGIYATGIDIVVSSNVVYRNAKAGIYAATGALAPVAAVPVAWRHTSARLVELSEAAGMAAHCGAP